MGYYTLALSGVMLELAILKSVKIIFRMDRNKNIETHYQKDKNVTKFIENIFNEKNIKIVSENYSIFYLDKEKSLYEVVVVYELHIPDQIDLKELIDDINKNKYVFKISTVEWN